MSHLPKEVLKYLHKYSLSQWKLEYNSNKRFALAVIVPAIKEYENIQKLILSLLQNDNKYFQESILIFVINSQKNSSEEVFIDNEKSLKFLRAIISQNTNTGNQIVNDAILSGLNFGLVDASSKDKELPEKDGGVGLARKIGMDLALKIFSYDSSAKNILACLDADCTVLSNYITEIYNQYNQRKLSAAVVNFEHPVDQLNDEAQAIICYEIFLRYYVLGLKYAGSKYAHHSIGSTITCDHISYIKAGGMNKRKAAEDFYFLEKLAKFCEIKKITGTTVYPSSRSSWRVPFGTGQRVERFLSKAKEEYLLYNPESFVILKKWLSVFNNNNFVSPVDYLYAAKQIHPMLEQFLAEQNFSESWSRIIENSKTQAKIHKQKYLWFDGFKTLKFIHYLRDKAYPLVNMFDALDDIFDMVNIRPPAKRDKKSIPALGVQRGYLDILREFYF